MTNSKFISWMAVIFWMGLIFFLSNQPATDSRELSSGITEFILNTAEKISPEIRNHMDTLHHIVRKNAHFMIYLVLGVLALNAVKKGPARGHRSAMYAVIICVLYAISDELHQLFVPGRSGEAKDVFIDSAGAIAGIGISLLMNKLFNRKKLRKRWNETAQEN